MAYPIPNWIQPPGDLAATYLNAYRAGAAVSEAQARLDAEAQERGVNLAVSEQRLQQQNMREQQELEMRKALSQAELGIRQASLENAQERIALTANAAASRMAEQQAFLKEREAGVDPIESMLRHPGMFTSAAPLVSAAKEYHERTTPFVPSDVTTPAGVRMVMSSRGHAVLAPKTTATGELEAGPVVDTRTGQPVPGMVSVGGRARNIPGYRDPIQQELNEIYKVWGPQLQGAYDIDKSQQPAFEKAQKRYAQLKAIQAGGGAPATARPTPAVPGAASIEEIAAKASRYKVGGRYPFPDGSVRVFKGGDPDIESNWEKTK